MLHNELCVAAQINSKLGILLSRLKRGIKAGSTDDGYTLVELLVVLTIISLLVGLVGPRVLGYLGDSKVKTARLQIEGFGAALDLFYLDSGRYPSASEGLNILVQGPAESAAWNGPYLKSGHVPLDPWGNPYRYRIQSEQSPPYEIVSLGSDGAEGGSGTAADISSSQR